MKFKLLICSVTFLFWEILFLSPLFATAPPQILHGPRLSIVTQTSITISWETDVPATSLVRYGLTSSYGYEVNDTTYVTFHSLTLTGLTTATLYHYQVSSTNQGGTVNSPDYTFSTAVEDTQSFRFISLADSRPNDENDPLPNAFRWIMRRTRQANPKIVLFAGDAVYGSADSTRLRTQWDDWENLTDTLAHSVPMYLSIGNHEANCYNQNYDGGLIFQDEFVQPTNGPTGFKELAYSFDYGNCHFVCLDSDVYNDPSRINSVQRQWLQLDLMATDKLHKFVFAHEHAYPPQGSTHSSLEKYPADRDAFWNILLAYHVDAYICGHIHLWNRDFFISSGYGNPPADTSVKQIIDGTCGAPITYGYGGEFYHFVVWDVNGREVKAKVVDNYGAVRDSFSYLTTPVRLSISPNITWVKRGENFYYTAYFANQTGGLQNFQYWADVILPNGKPYSKNPVYGPDSLTLGDYMLDSLIVTHRIPNSAPLGTYLYIGKIGNYPQEVWSQDTLKVKVVALEEKDFKSQ